jgi:hypothetical protein
VLLLKGDESSLMTIEGVFDSTIEVSYGRLCENAASTGFAPIDQHRAGCKTQHATSPVRIHRTYR